MRARDAVLGAAAMVWAALCPFGVAAAAKVQQAPSSRIAIDVPEGYQPARQFTGFVNDALGVSLVVVELPSAAYEQLAGSLTPEALAGKGIAKAEAGKLPRAEPYLYMRGEQASDQGPVAKFMVAFRNKSVTALVTANVLRSALEKGAVAPADVERMLSSASIASSPAPSRDVFRLEHLGPFKSAGSILGTTRAYTLDGRFEPGHKAERRVVLIVSPSLDRRPVQNAMAQAETLLSGLPGIVAPKVAEQRKLQVAGLPAIELLGTATDKDDGSELALWQVLVLPPDGGYFRLVAQMAADEQDRLLPELRRIADGFRPVE